MINIQSQLPNVSWLLLYRYIPDIFQVYVNDLFVTSGSLCVVFEDECCITWKKTVNRSVSASSSMACGLVFPVVNLLFLIQLFVCLCYEFRSTDSSG